MSFSHLSEWLAWQETLHPKPIDLGLERLQRTLQRLNWQAPKCPTITVGGTNGKGSTVALLARILSAAGYRAGTFTSPHLIRYNERITLAGQEISDASLLAAFERIDAARGADTLTFFEFNTLAALLAFETAGLDAIVLEVGMGGRLDAVNVVDADVAVISSIALDHCDWLGNDIETIAEEKAGILRAGRPAIFGAREMPHSIERTAQALASDLQVLGCDFDWEVTSAREWRWRGRSTVYEDLPMPALEGRIQLDNAAASLAALCAISHRLPVDREAIECGLRTVSLLGRFQVFECEGRWILDVAHNPAAAKILAQQLRALSLPPVAGGRLGSGPPRGHALIAVCGVLGDKDAVGIAAALEDVFDGWVVTQLDSPRSIATDVLAAKLRSAGANVVDEYPSVESACSRARELAGSAGCVVVFGSFLAVGPALMWLESRCGILR
jgi:dihydrofolate synthase/folylpolyglutamate synthase